jgi:hypothetical protein
VPVDEGAQDRGAHRRGRGQAALTKLLTTADFSNEVLEPPDRKLILFLLVVLADAGGGVLTAAYRAVLHRHAETAGHWSYGKSLAAMQKAGAKFLGQSARQRPSWDKVQDLLEAVLEGARLDAVRAVAAGLFCQAAGLDRPTGSFRGEIDTPQWTREDPLAADTIRRHVATLPGGRPAPARLESDELADLRSEHEKLRQTLDSVIRAFRQVDGELAELKQRHSVAERELFRLRVKAFDAGEALRAENERLLWGPFLVAARGGERDAQILNLPPAVVLTQRTGRAASRADGNG